MPVTAQKYRGGFLYAALMLLLSILSPSGQTGSAANHVLDLDGKEGWVDLPANIFNGLEEATVEAWVKWRSLPATAWSRFFSYGEQNVDTGIEASQDGSLQFFLARPSPGVARLQVASAIRTNEWYHLAAVSGPGGMQLFLDGAVIGTNSYTGSFSAIKSGPRFRLGRSIVDDEPLVDGQLAEVRVWKVARSEAQIRKTMFQRLSGREPDLVGLWNFEDGTANDSAPGAHHGRMLGGAKITAASVLLLQGLIWQTGSSRQTLPLDFKQHPSRRLMGLFGLRNQGYKVMPAASGAEALKSVHAQLPDLILLDLMMPDMDGLEVCRRLKADSATTEVPVVYLTASNEMEHLVQGFEVGAVDYVTKPFNPPELLARVRTHLELKHARQLLREMNDEKNEFMGIAAHDLRNPLGAITGYAELLIEEMESLRPSVPEPAVRAVREAGECAGRIRETSRRMAEMVQNLLDANRIERGEMQLHLAPADLGPVVNLAAGTQRPHAVAKQQTIHLESEAALVMALVDPTVTVQVLENLVSNAVKYSPPGKDIYVRLKKQGQGARVEVQDHGPGLSADDQKKLFGKFARLSAKPTGGEHSIGLGLSIVKKMVEAMHGKLWCESVLGNGTTFIVEFPAA